MPFNGSGVYTAPAADFPAVTQTVISSTKYNNVINDIATALSTCLTKDGQQVATANIPFGGFRATNVGITAIAGSVGTPAINVSDAATGLYRSAASELAVSIVGTQRARFDATGLIVTGAVSVSTTLTASTSVVTPLVNAATGADLGFGAGGGSQWKVLNVDGKLVPVTDNTYGIGNASFRVLSVCTPIIDSGTAGSLSLRTNNGKEQFRVVNGGDGTNIITTFGGTTGNVPAISTASSSDANVGLEVSTKGTGSVNFYSRADINQKLQFQVIDTASATRNITVTGSNGGNPTLGVTAGSLAITPAVVIAGATLQIGTNPASVASGSAVNVPYASGISTRNATNAGDLDLIFSITKNAVTNIVVVGSGSGNGVVLRGRSGGAAPTTSDLNSGEWTVWRDTGGATTKLYYNNAGAIQSVALA